MLRSSPRMNPAPQQQLTTAAAAAAAIMILCVTTLSFGQQHQRFDCPLAQHLEPCSCEEREQGLDVSCHDISSVQLREVLDVVGLTRQRVWFLRISRAELSAFPRRLLEGLDVVNLVLVRSNVTGIDSDAFAGDASRVESLDLEGNRLDRVPSRALSVLRSLAALSLDHNLIEVLEAHSFSSLESLLWLSLYGNRIRLIDSRAFLGTEASLTRLNLGGNRLGQVPRYALQRLNCLQGLRLHGNSVSEILVENLPASLCELDLSRNDLERLEADSFVTLKHLSALDLEDNKIRTIHEEAFNGIYDSLEWLKLGGNKLTNIPHHAFRNLTRLRQLDLRSNKLSRVDVDSFADYGKTLKFIFLQKNSIQTIEHGAFDVLESAQWMYIHSNQLTALRYDTFRPVIDNLHVLDLHGNPYNCNCEVMWFRDWLLSKGQNVANLPKETRCHTPEEHAQKPIVKLNNSTFDCSCGNSVSSKLTNNINIFSILFLSVFVFFMGR